MRKCFIVLRFLWDVLRSPTRRYFDILWLLWDMLRSPTFSAAESAVTQVAKDQKIRVLGQKEGKTSFCPRCGQSTQRDVRHDEAFEMAFGAIPPDGRICDLHFAIELACWLRR